MRIKHIWESMKARCYNTNHKHYKDYGGRGITICDEWLNSFESFYEWSINNGYNDRLTIDRIDNEKSYSPENCCFVLAIDQQQNKRNTIKCESGLSLRAECRMEDVPYTSVRVQIKKGHSIKEAIEIVKRDREARGVSGQKEITYCDSAYEAIGGADALAVLTDWAEFKELDLEKIKMLLTKPQIADYRNTFDCKKAKEER